jgi:hypothetical protein
MPHSWHFKWPFSEIFCKFQVIVSVPQVLFWHSKVEYVPSILFCELHLRIISAQLCSELARIDLYHEEDSHLEYSQQNHVRNLTGKCNCLIVVADLQVFEGITVTLHWRSSYSSSASLHFYSHFLMEKKSLAAVDSQIFWTYSIGSIYQRVWSHSVVATTSWVSLDHYWSLPLHCYLFSCYCYYLLSETMNQLPLRL